MKWDARDSARMSHSDMLVRFLEKYPEKKESMLTSLLFNMDELKYFISSLTTFIVPTPLTEARAEFILKLIAARRQFLIDTIESYS